MKLKYDAMGIEEESEDESYYLVHKTEEKYNIIGKVWNDLNKNAQRDDEESGIENIQVILIDANTMKFVKDAENNNISVLTAADGTYQFENIVPGKYMVAFLSDMDTYGVSQYQKD